MAQSNWVIIATCDTCDTFFITLLNHNYLISCPLLWFTHSCNSQILPHTQTLASNLRLFMTKKWRNSLRATPINCITIVIIMQRAHALFSKPGSLAFDQSSIAAIMASPSDDRVGLDILRSFLLLCYFKVRNYYRSLQVQSTDHFATILLTCLKVSRSPYHCQRGCSQLVYCTLKQNEPFAFWEDQHNKGMSYLMLWRDRLELILRTSTGLWMSWRRTVQCSTSVASWGPHVESVMCFWVHQLTSGVLV